MLPNIISALLGISSHNCNPKKTKNVHNQQKLPESCTKFDRCQLFCSGVFVVNLNQIPHDVLKAYTSKQKISAEKEARMLRIETIDQCSCCLLFYRFHVVAIDLVNLINTYLNQKCYLGEIPSHICCYWLKSSGQICAAIFCLVVLGV